MNFKKSKFLMKRIFLMKRKLNNALYQQHQREQWHEFSFELKFMKILLNYLISSFYE